MMIERVARVLAEQFLCETRECMNAARAAIAAMREPTFEMRKAGNISITDKSYSIAAAYQAMIDAALEGK
jgi:hypothetical protein